MASGPITAWQVEEEGVEIVAHFLFLSSKITAVMKSEDNCFLTGKL